MLVLLLLSLTSQPVIYCCFAMYHKLRLPLTNGRGLKFCTRELLWPPYFQNASTAYAFNKSCCMYAIQLPTSSEVNHTSIALYSAIFQMVSLYKDPKGEKIFESQSQANQTRSTTSTTITNDGRSGHSTSVLQTDQRDTQTAVQLLQRSKRYSKVIVKNELLTRYLAADSSG